MSPCSFFPERFLTLKSELRAGFRPLLSTALWGVTLKGSLQLGGTNLPPAGFECVRGSRILVGFRSTRRASSGTGAGPWGLRICWGPTVRAALLDFITAINRWHSVFHGNEDENIWS